MLALILTGMIFCLKIWLIYLGINILKNIIHYAKTDYPEQ